jgi:hypothetical protein
MGKFDYGHTCPVIDRQLGKIGDSVNDELIDLVDGVGLNHNDFMDVINDYTDYIMRHLEDCFEDVRSCNEDMRKEAERQIDDVIYYKELAEEHIKELEREIEDLKYKLNN